MNVEGEPVIRIFARDKGGHDILLIIVGIDRFLGKETLVDGNDVVVHRIVFDELTVDNRKIRPVIGNVIFKIIVMRVAYIRMVVYMNLSLIFLIELRDHAFKHRQIGSRDGCPKFEGYGASRSGIVAVIASPASAGSEAQRHGSSQQNGN